jgi:hypothetical protein
MDKYYYMEVIIYINVVGSDDKVPRLSYLTSLSVVSYKSVREIS